MIYPPYSWPHPWGPTFTEGARELFSVCCFILCLFTSYLVKELARNGPWKENNSLSFLFHTDSHFSLGVSGYEQEAVEGARNKVNRYP